MRIGSRSENGGASRGGFTLVEVLVSLVVLSTAIVLIAQGFATGIRGTELSQRATLAEFLAEETIAKLESGEITIKSDSEGDFAPDFEAYSWSTTCTPGSLTGLTQVAVRVMWEDRGETREFLVVRLINAREQTSRSTGKKQESQQQ